MTNKIGMSSEGTNEQKRKQERERKDSTIGIYQSFQGYDRSLLELHITHETVNKKKRVRR